MKLRIGVLALQGDVAEHINATKEAAKELCLDCQIIKVRTKEELLDLNGLIIPGGESTVFQKLLEREGMFEEIKKIPAIFGTCAGAIMLAKIVHNKESDQRTLELMDIEIDRNSYGRQIDSFEEKLQTSLGSINAVFIRAPRILSISSNVRSIAIRNNEVIASEQSVGGNYYLAVCFHPEMTSTLFHKYFISKIKL